MSRQLLETIVPEDWDSGTPAANSGFTRVRWLQGLSDLFDRPLKNRLSIVAPNTAINANGAIQSLHIGVGPLQPKRYAEFTVKTRVSFNLNSVGPAYVYVYRTLGNVPPAGVAPNAGDVIVGGDAFLGGPTSPGVNQSGSFSFLDAGLDVTKKYSYYLAVQAPNGNVLNLVNNSQLLVMERS